MQEKKTHKSIAQTPLSTRSNNNTPLKVFKFKNWSLSLFLLVLFLISIIGQFFAGIEVYREELLKYKITNISISYWDYLTSGHFISSVAENMESEFLQMVVFVYSAVFLYQIGSAESNRLPEQKTSEDKEEDQKEKEFCQKQRKKFSFSWKIYENSLTLALLFLFLVSFVIHAFGSLKLMNLENQALNLPLMRFWDIFGEADFWFQSFQNWQSEFFSIAVMSLLSIFLRQKGSPQSKKMYDSPWKTGN